MKKDVIKLVLLAFALAGTALSGGVASPAPEIDPGTIAMPLALVGGAVLIIRSRLRH
ncbi:MAG TPA: hypothetical protein VGF49_04430 [Candidatus Solibacter sp.]|jgi:hypothetical protein